MKLTRLRVIASGSTIETYIYRERALAYDFKNRRKGTRSKIVVTDEESLKRKIESRRRSMQRSSSNLRRLVNSNAGRWLKGNNKPYLSVFTTFTFAEDIRDIKTANSIFSKFIKRLNYYITGESKAFLKYVGVTEFQDLNRGGVIHYHVIFFNLKKILKNTLFEIWEQGNIDIKGITHVDNIGAYISKYMSKHFEDNRLDGQKRYFPSRGLLRPIDIRDEKEAHEIIKSLPKGAIKKTKDFSGKYHGKVTYTQYKLNKQETLFDFIKN